MDAPHKRTAPLRRGWARSPWAATAVGASAVVALAVFALLVLLATGATPTSLNQVAYVPIVFAAYRFGWRGSLAAGLFVMTLTSPILAALGVPNGGPEAWLMRTVGFLAVGTLVGLLFDRMRSAMTATRRERERAHARKREAMAIFARCAEAKDENTGRHVVRIADTSRELARTAGLDAQLVDEIGWSAMLHDVGKLHIPDQILIKPGRLTPEEWDLMQLHTILGERILGSGEGFRVARRIARWHHENFDGTGYPDGLKGDAIPFEARIVRVCDAFDAMTNDRPYSRARSAEEALEEIERFAGRQFDPELARLFIANLARIDVEARVDSAAAALGVRAVEAAVR